MTVHIKTIADRGTSLGWTNSRSLTIDAGLAAGELRIGFDADELLGFAIGASYIKSLLVEAARQRIRVTNIAVDVSTEPPGETSIDCGRVIALTVAADADEGTIAELIERTDRVAPISNLLRQRVAVRLTEAHIVKKE
jgi:organic hydroperoxide reductase OsmC/OhrA